MNRYPLMRIQGRNVCKIQDKLNRGASFIYFKSKEPKRQCNVGRNFIDLAERKSNEKWDYYNGIMNTINEISKIVRYPGVVKQTKHLCNEIRYYLWEDKISKEELDAHIWERVKRIKERAEKWINKKYKKAA